MSGKEHVGESTARSDNDDDKVAQEVARDVKRGLWNVPHPDDDDSDGWNGEQT